MRQTEIAALTGQAQSEVSAIMSGRQVMAYDLLERIAAGLGIPRGHLGLAYDTEDSEPATGAWDEEAERARCLAHAAKVTLGRAVFGEPAQARWTVETTPIPLRIGPTDVEQVKRATAEFAKLEWRHGGGLVQSAVAAQLKVTRALLGASATDDVRRQMLVAVALLHRRASCAAFDVGFLDVARHHILRALELARGADQPELLACLFYAAGRMELYHGPPDTALRLFQFGYPAALSSRLPRLRALLEISEARAYSKMGAAEQAKQAMSAAIESFHEGAEREQPDWLEFFNAAELYGAAGIVWSENRDEQRAIAALRKSLAERPEHAVLYRAFDMAELAACHLRNGDVGEGMRIGTAVVHVVGGLQSTRARTRLAPLLAASSRGGADLRPLRDRLVELRGL